MTTTYKQTIEYTIDIVPTINKNLVAYRISTTDSRDDGYTISGVTDKSNIHFLKKGIGNSYSLGWRYVTDAFLEEVKNWGYGGKDNIYSHYDTEIYQDEYDCAVNGRGNLIRNDMSSHMIFDHNDEALPVGIIFNYVVGMMKDGVYHLDKALEILKDRDDVYITQEIESIPYYNSYPGSREGIAFIWRPSVEDYRKIWNHCLETKRKYPSAYMREAVFALDLLGLRAGKAAKSDLYYGDIS